MSNTVIKLKRAPSSGAVPSSLVDGELALDHFTGNLWFKAANSQYKLINPSGGSAIPTGGSTGQVLKKVSAADFDYSWQADATGGGGGSSYQTGTANVFFGNTYSLSSKTITITDANVTSSNCIIRVNPIGAGDPTLPMDTQLDEMEMDNFLCSGFAANTGNLVINIKSEGPINGYRLFNYTIEQRS